MKILVVDDSKVMRMKLKSLIGGAGIPVTAILEAAHVDLLLKPDVPVVECIPDVDADVDELWIPVVLADEDALLLAHLGDHTPGVVVVALDRLAQVVDGTGQRFAVITLRGTSRLRFGNHQGGDSGRQPATHQIATFHH